MAQLGSVHTFHIILSGLLFSIWSHLLDSLILLWETYNSLASLEGRYQVQSNVNIMASPPNNGNFLRTAVFGPVFTSLWRHFQSQACHLGCHRGADSSSSKRSALGMASSCVFARPTPDKHFQSIFYSCLRTLPSKPFLRLPSGSG